jgi:tyrosinase
MIQIGAIRRMTSLLLAIFLFSLLSTFVSALPPTVPPLHTPAFSRYDYGIHREKLIRRQNTTIAITGALGGILLDGTPPVRKEIRELQQDAAAWTLYLLGLDSMQFTDQHDPLSWYQIAGRSVTEVC